LLKKKEAAKSQPEFRRKFGDSDLTGSGRRESFRQEWFGVG
jgi:hypothetical protein